jgi:hypothetical protein
MSFTAFLIGNVLLALVMLTWNLYTQVSLRGAEPESKTRWTVAVGFQWRFGAATAALIAVAVGLFDAILFGEGEKITVVAGIFSMLALSIAVAQAFLSLILSAQLMGRGIDARTSSFSDDSPWRRPAEWTTAVGVPVCLIGALIFGIAVWSQS